VHPAIDRRASPRHGAQLVGWPQRSLPLCGVGIGYLDDDDAVALPKVE
jgi:hypothetical protein